MARKGWKRRRGVWRMDKRIISGFRPRQRVERQPITHGRVAGDQITVLATQKPRSAAPASARRVPRHREGITDDLLETLREYAHQALAFEGILEPRIERIDIGGQAPLPPHEIESVLVGREYVPRVEPQPFSYAAQKLCGSGIRRSTGPGLVRDQRLGAPDRFAVGAPKAVERPAGQLLPRIPLALAKMDEALGAVVPAQAVIKIGGKFFLVRSHRRGVPFLAVR